MKLVIFLILTNIALADVDIGKIDLKVPPVNADAMFDEELPKPPPECKTKESGLPNWAWFAIGGVAASMVWGTFWYKRNEK